MSCPITDSILTAARQRKVLSRPGSGIYTRNGYLGIQFIRTSLPLHRIGCRTHGSITKGTPVRNDMKSP